MGKKKQINIGDKFGKLTIKSITEFENYMCDCDCGNKDIEKTRDYLIGKVKSKSCGCACNNGNNFKETNNITKSKCFDNEYYKINDNWIVKAYRNNILHEFIFDDYGINYLKEINKRLAVDSRGYCYITLSNMHKQFFLHNLLIYGLDYYKKDFDNQHTISDHIDGNRNNNRLDNLRKANKFDNNQNAKTRKDNTCGIKGFTINIPKDRPVAYIKVRIQANHKRIGQLFPLSPQGLKDAIEWSYKTRLELHQDFSNFGYDTTNKSIEEIIEEQSRIFIDNLNEYHKKLFDNDGYIYSPKKFKSEKDFNAFNERRQLNV